MSYFKPLREELKNYMDKQQIDGVYQAFLLAEKGHKGQTRYTGEPYITHPVAVAQELAEMHLDAKAITAAILHDVVEDTSASLDDIDEIFGPYVAAEVHAGAVKSAQASVYTKGEISLALTGTGEVTAVDKRDVFGTRLDEGGVVKWTRTFGGMDYDAAAGVAVLFRKRQQFALKNAARGDGRDKTISPADLPVPEESV